MYNDTKSQEMVSIVNWFEALVSAQDGYPIGFSLVPGGPHRSAKLSGPDRPLDRPVLSVSPPAGLGPRPPGRPTPPGLTT